MENIIPIHRTQRVFNLDEARALLPVVLKITAETQRKVSHLLNRLEAIKYGSSEAAQDLEEQVQGIVDHWQKKMISLGAHPKGLWLADFDNGQGYYCWKYPESEIGYWHGYQDGFSGRKQLSSEGLE